MVIKVINKKVVFIHTSPNFDTSGMIEVRSMPEPENNGMIAELFWDNGFYYEYHNPPEEVEEEEEMIEFEQSAPQPTLEQRVTYIEHVTADVITALNDKGIVP